MQKNQVQIDGDSFVYAPTRDHRVSVVRDNVMWHVRVNYLRVEAQSEVAYSEPFSALREAWRVALVMKNITNEAELELVLQDVFDMDVKPSHVLPISIANVMRQSAKDGKHGNR